MDNTVFYILINENVFNMAPNSTRDTQSRSRTFILKQFDFSSH